MRKSNLFFILISLIMLSSCVKDNTSGSTENTSGGENPDDTEKPVLTENILLGYNGRSTEGPSWTDGTFLSLVSDTKTMCIRYPGGTQANSWDWKEGKLVDKTDPKYLFRIGDLVAGLPQTAQVVYVMNMVNTPARVGVEKPLTDQSVEALNLKIDDALLALKEFERLGRLPMAVELGNEFYFQNEHAAFYGQNPELYLEHVRIICKEIHEVYPDMKIAIVATKGGTKGRDAWNKVVYDALNSDEFLKDNVYAVVQHHYISETTGNTALRITDNSTAEQALAEAFAYMESVKKDYDDVPEGYKLWITEFGITKYSKLDEEGMWPLGLSYAAMVLSWLEMGDKIDCYMLHHITNNPSVINTSVMRLGPAAVAYSIVTDLMEGCKSVTRGKNYAEGNIKSWIFTYEDEKKVLLMNTSASAVNDIDVSDLLGTETYSVEQHYAPDIIKSPVVKDNGIKNENLDNIRTFEIRPFALVLCNCP